VKDGSVAVFTISSRRTSHKDRQLPKKPLPKSALTNKENVVYTNPLTTMLWRVTNRSILWRPFDKEIDAVRYDTNWTQDGPAMDNIFSWGTKNFKHGQLKMPLCSTKLRVCLSKKPYTCFYWKAIQILIWLASRDGLDHVYTKCMFFLEFLELTVNNFFLEWWWW
jgi:hypothetical protein